MFSSRLPDHLQTNALTVALHEASLAGVAVSDLTASNPTVAALPYPPDLLAALIPGAIHRGDRKILPGNDFVELEIELA